MKILLLGGSSRLGTAMRRLWADYEIVSPSRTDVDVFDAATFDAFLGQSKPDWVINCVAYNNMDGAEGEGRAEATRLNGELPGVLAMAAARLNIPFVHISTDCVFDGAQVAGYDEAAEPHPVSVYGESKRLGEVNVLNAHPGAYVVRTSRLYGLSADSPNAKKSFVELIFADAQKAARIMVNGSEVTGPTYVDDLVRHLDQHILRAKPAPGIYHIANSGGATWVEWATEIGKDMQLPVAFAPRDWRSLRRPAARPMFSILRSTKLPELRPWQEALREFIASKPWSFEPRWKDIGIAGAAIEPQPRIGEPDGAVLHMIPGGTKNAEGFGPDILDIYASTSKGKNQSRGGHYHLKLDELFFTVSGAALWILSDFRKGSPTQGKTIGVIVGTEAPGETHGFPCFTLDQGALARLRVPAGVYHSYFPLTDERVMVVAVGSTPYDKEDYRYPTMDEVPELKSILERLGITY